MLPPPSFGVGFLLSVKKISYFFATLIVVGVGGEDQNPGKKL
jgi:hypothetical protein